MTVLPLAEVFMHHNTMEGMAMPCMEDMIFMVHMEGMEWRDPQSKVQMLVATLLDQS